MDFSFNIYEITGITKKRIIFHNKLKKRSRDGWIPDCYWLDSKYKKINS